MFNPWFTGSRRRKAYRPRVPLYDVASEYARSLKHARVARGEPVAGLDRAQWKARRWVGQNPAKVAGASMGLAALVLLLLSSKRAKSDAEQWVNEAA